MSYEPRLIISHADLQDNASMITQYACEAHPSQALLYLEKLLVEKPITLKGVAMIVCQPELTGFNKKVRDLLYEFDIEFATDN
jgi:hypothetical protein